MKSYGTEKTKQNSTINNFLVQSATGLQYAHEHNVLHRDIKPGNLLLNRKHPKEDHLDLWVAADFGIAITAHPLHTLSPLTTQDAHGTLSYTAPEQFDKEAKIPSDIYSLGVVAYELLTGKQPFICADQYEYYNAHHFQPPPSFAQARGTKGMDDVLADLEEVVMHALAKEPAKRPQNIEVFALTLKDVHAKAVERKELQRKVVDMASLPREKQNEKTQSQEQLPQEGQIFLNPNPREKKDEKFFAGSTHFDPAVQEQRKNAIAPTVSASQNNAQIEQQSPEQPQEIPQQPAVNQPPQAEAAKPLMPPSAPQEHRIVEARNKKEEAEKPHLTPAEAIPPRYPIKQLIPSFKGIIFNIWGKYEKALVAFDQAIDLDPTNAVNYKCKGDILVKLSRNEEALAAYDQGIKLDPKYQEAHRDRGVALKQLDRNVEALMALNRAVNLNPKDARAHGNRGEVLLNLGQYKEALQASNQAIARNPHYALAHKNKGDALYKLGRLDESLQAFDQAIFLNPTNAQAYNNKGIVLYQLGQYEEALRASNQAIARNPHYALAHNNKGLVLNKLNQPEKALQAYDQALQLNPTYAQVYNNKGHTLFNLGRYKEALAAYDQALLIDPAYKLAYENKQLVLKELRKAKIKNALSRLPWWRTP